MLSSQLSYPNITPYSCESPISLLSLINIVVILLLLEIEVVVVVVVLHSEVVLNIPPIDCLVYVEAIVGFYTQVGDVNYVWRLKKSLYSLCQSPQNYTLYTKAKLKPRGFVQSIANPCLFMSADVICLIYVDDALLL